ncbi:MAG: hypothetical protein ACYTXC_15690 [Nostoc sp.]
MPPKSWAGQYRLLIQFTLEIPSGWISDRTQMTVKASLDHDVVLSGSDVYDDHKSYFFKKR